MAQSGRPLEILHVITSLERAGAQTVLARLVQAQGAAFHHTVVCLREEDFYAVGLRNCGADVLALGMPAGRVTLSGLRRLAASIRRVRPDVVQTWMYHADLIGGWLPACRGFDRSFGACAIRTWIPSAPRDPRGWSFVYVRGFPGGCPWRLSAAPSVQETSTSPRDMQRESSW